MARNNHSEEFRRQAVDLYESTPGATFRGIAEDLGIVRGTVRHWLEAYGTGKKAAADGTLTSSPLHLDDHCGLDSGDRHGFAAEPAQLAGAEFDRPRVVVGADEDCGELG